MDTDHLQIFASVCRNGSLSAAARELKLDPSRVSRVIQTLEAELGVPLFQRTTRSVVLTDAGRIYQTEIAVALEALSTARARVADVQQVPAGELRISCPTSYGLLNVVPWLADFQARYPQITLDLRLTDAPPDLGPDGVDVAIALGPLRDSDAVASILAEMDTHLCASPAYLERYGTPTHPQEVAGHAALLLDMPGFDSTLRFRQRSADPWQEVPLRAVLRTSNALALRECALAGCGVTLQAGWIVDPDLRAGLLVDLFPGWTVRAANFSNPAMWLLHPARPYISQKIRVFIDFARDRLVR